MSEDDIGQNLRDIRATLGLSLSKAADLTGVSKAMLGQIERGESSPTVATLWKIARGFQISLTALLQKSTVDGTSTVAFPGSLVVRVVFPFDPRLGVETFEVTLSPGQSHASEPHDTGMVEDVFVLSGVLDVLSEGQWREVVQGQGVRFAADQPHEYRAGAEGATFLNIHHYARPLV